MSKTFTITFDGSIDLTVDEIWPDGDAPDNPTEEDVAKAMRDSGDKTSVMHDWCLDEAVEVRIDYGTRVWR